MISKIKKQSSAILIENRYIEMLVMLLRISGFKENIVKESNKHGNNRSISAAIQFINDNIEHKLTVTDVATYCHVSVRHLTREFKSVERIAPAKYIRQEKMNTILVHRLKNILVCRP